MINQTAIQKFISEVILSFWENAIISKQPQSLRSRHVSSDQGTGVLNQISQFLLYSSSPFC